MTASRPAVHDAAAVRERWRDSASAAAARAYEAAHGNPVPDQARGMRMRVSRRAAASAVVALGAISVVATSVARGAEAPAEPLLVASATPSAAVVTVHVAGAVERPGLYDFAAGARAGDAVTAAGGASAAADLDRVNLARPLRDGEQLYVPFAGQDDGVINVNRATAAELEELPGVGPVLAERIVEYRDDHGPFLTLADLAQVPGVGSAVVDAARDVATT